MGKVMSVAAGKIQRFNVENRAQKVISQAKPTPAPRFESNLKDLERVLKGEKNRWKHCEIAADKHFAFVDHPEIIEQAGKKDAGLDDRLKSVFVTSSDYVSWN